MELIILWAIGVLAFYSILYVIIKTAVRNGIIETSKTSCADSDDGKDNGASISEGHCHKTP